MGVRFFLCICVFNIFCTGLRAQSTIGKRLKVLPTCYMSFPTGEPCSENEPVLQMAQQNLWVVFAESDNTQTYANYNKAVPLKTINYMDAFFVIDKKGPWMELVKWQLLDGLTWDQRSGVLKKSLEYFGWVNEDKLLKWRHCLVDKDSRFTIKALTYDNADCMLHPENCGKKKSLKLYSNPGLTIASKNGVNLFEFLYEFDRSKDGKSVLVGGTDELLVSEGSIAANKILGWVPVDAVVEWKQRLVLEPNWDPDAVYERKSKKVKTTVFADAQSALKFLDDPSTPEAQFKDKEIWNDDPYQAEEIPEWYRLPILDASVQSITTQPLATGIRTKIFNKQGETVFSTAEEDHWRNEEGLQRKNFRKVNVVFVIDGSKSMTTFQLSIFQAIDQFINTVKQETSKPEAEASAAVANTYKIGAVIYRGAQDENCNGEKLDVQTKDLTSDYDDLEGFVGREVKKTGCGEKEHTKQYYKGLYEAIRMFANCKKQSNLIVVIGNSGNAEGPDASRLKDAMQQDMIDYQVGMLAFQVNSGYENYYTNFLDQSMDLIGGTSNALRDSTGKHGVVDKKFMNNDWIDVPHLHKLVCPEKSPVPGEFAFADASAPMNADTLQNNIVALIGESIGEGEKVLDAIQAKLDGLGRATEITQGVQLFLRNMGMDDSTIRKAAFENVQLYIKGYVVYKPVGFAYPLYKKCVFMQEQELLNLIDNLSKLQAPASTEKELREKMLSGFKGVVTAYWGPREAKRIIATKTAEEIMEMLIGLPVKNDLFSKFHLGQIMDKRVVPDDQLQSLQTDLVEKLAQLKEYSDKDSHYFLSGDQKFIWVPEDYFP